MKLPLLIEEPQRGIGWPRLVLRGVLAGVLLSVLFELGPSLREGIAATDEWIAAAGVLAPLAFILVAGLLIPLFFPVTALKVSAGALFGPFFGALICLAGQLGAAVIIFALGRSSIAGQLRERLRRFAEGEPRLAVVRDAAEEGTAKRQFLVRMTPLSFALVSYVLAALGVRFKPYLLGCLSTVPSTLVTVWFAHAARRATELEGQVEGEARDWNLLTIGAALGALALFGWFARSARPKLFGAAEAENPAA